MDRYDPRFGVPFAGYAIPTIVGQIKRYFRNAGWTVRAPRQLQELRLHLASVTEDLTHALLRSPMTAELAVELSVSQGDVLAAQRSTNAYRPLSLERPALGSEGPRLIDSLGRTQASKQWIVAKPYAPGLPVCRRGNGASSSCGTTPT